MGPHAAAPEGLKKRRLRTVLPAMVIETTQEPPAHSLPLHWQGGVHPEWRGSRNPVGQHGRATEHESMTILRERSQVWRDLTMAATLHRLGSRTGTGQTGRAPSVAGGRYQERLPKFPQGTDWLTLTQAAQQLGVRATVVKRCIPPGTVPARHVVAQAPWLIPRTAVDRVAVHAAGPMVRTGHRPLSCRTDRRASPGQAALEAGDTPAAAAPAETYRAPLIAGAP